jgi:hypothetical protein
MSGHVEEAALDDLGGRRGCGRGVAGRTGLDEEPLADDPRSDERDLGRSPRAGDRDRTGMTSLEGSGGDRADQRVSSSGG